MWLLLVPSLARAEPSDTPTDEASSSTEVSERSRSHLSSEVFVQGIEHGLAVGGGAELVQGRGFLRGEATGASGSRWIGKGTVGVDIFPRSKFDLTVGLFAGTVGQYVLPAWDFRPLAGCELGLGTRLGPISARYRHAEAFGGEIAQDELRATYHLGKAIAVFGQATYLDPRDDMESTAGGVGAMLTI